jgi:hypothetical protein
MAPKYINISIFLFIFLFSCINENYKVINNKTSDIIITELETISDSIELTEDYLNNYYTQTLFSKNSNDYMVAHNHKTHYIDIFNISKKEMSNIKLYEEGQNSINRDINGIYANSIDSIWLYSTGNIYLLNTLGEIEKKYNLPVDKDEFIINSTNYANATIKLHFDSSRNALFYTSIRMGDKNSFFINELNILTMKVEKTELIYTESEQGIGKKFGWMQHPNVTYKNNLIIYNFPFNSNIYTINLDSKERNSFGGKSIYTKNYAAETTEMAIDNWFRHTIENIHFYEINNDKYKDCYYRLHLDGADFNSKDYKGDQLNSKRLFLTIFDSSFNIINEFPLTKNKYNIVGGWGVLKDGFFIIKDNPLKENVNYEQLEYDIIIPS